MVSPVAIDTNGIGPDEAIKVAIIEDDPGTRASLREIIESDPQCRFVGELAAVSEAIERLPLLAPQVVLVDVNLPDGTGIECVRQLSPAMSETEFVMLTLYQDGDLLFDALAAGAHGYLIKPVRVDELLAAIHDVVAGGAPMSSMVARRIVRSFERPVPARVAPLPKADESVTLAPREREVLNLLAAGAMYKEVAKHLGVSRNTVITHIRRIYKKLHVHSRHHAVERYKRMK
jgi:DNA-binding NarL/FixJ family response regulator